MRISIPHSQSGFQLWTLVCQLKLSPKCKQTFTSPDETEEACAPCAVKQRELDQIAEDRRIDLEGLTPDDHPETGYLDIMTDEEIANAPWLSPDVRGRWF